MNSMTTLAHSRVRYQGALSQACVDLSRKRSDESGIGCKSLLAGTPWNISVLFRAAPANRIGGHRDESFDELISGLMDAATICSQCAACEFIR